MAIAWNFRDDYEKGGFQLHHSVDPHGGRLAFKSLVYTLVLNFLVFAPYFFDLESTKPLEILSHQRNRIDSFHYCQGPRFCRRQGPRQVVSGFLSQRSFIFLFSWQHSLLIATCNFPLILQLICYDS